MTAREPAETAANPADILWGWPPGTSSDRVPAHWAVRELAPGIQERLAAIVSPAHLKTQLDSRFAQSHDRLPWGQFRLRNGNLGGTLACAVVCPGNADEVAAIVRLAGEAGLRLVPYGAGSGVLGGTIPLDCEVIVDLRRLDRIIAINEQDALVTVEAGMNGRDFEAALNARGFTCGHYPQSLEISTVGGWAACRGAGQGSSRYGKIEDIVIGLKAVLPDGRLLEVRPVARRSVGPSLKDLLIGAEGTLGIITELTMRIWRKPPWEQGVVLAFPTLAAGLDALREAMQAELRPQVARLYDLTESRQRTEGLPEFAERPILAVLKFAGLQRLAMLERDLTLEICRARGAIPSSEGPYHHWETQRYRSLSAQWQLRGYYMDTIEIALPWSALPGTYERIGQAVRDIDPQVYFAAHWSHIYPEGVCQYMTLRLNPMPVPQALALHARLWEAVEGLSLALGGTIAHHHGVGLFRGPWMTRELNAGMDILQSLKDAMDPANLLNPGKLGLRLSPGG